MAITLKDLVVDTVSFLLLLFALVLVVAWALGAI